MKKYNEDRITRSADMTLGYRNIGNKQDVALNAACLLHDVIVFMRTRLRSADVHESATRPAATRASKLRWKERARKAGCDKPGGRASRNRASRPRARGRGAMPSSQRGTDVCPSVKNLLGLACHCKRVKRGAAKRGESRGVIGAEHLSHFTISKGRSNAQP